MIILEVSGRNGILIHPSNDASKELFGCIAPVSNLMGSGKGNESRKANKKLKEILEVAFSKRETVFITIKSK